MTYSLKAIMPLAPFLDEEFLDELAEQTYLEKPEDLVGIAPFLSESTLDRMAKRLDGVNDSVVLSLAPFLSEGMLNELAKQCGVADKEKLKKLAPFLNEETLDALMEQIIGQENWSMDDVMAFAPFLGSNTLRSITLAALKANGGED